MTFQKLKGQKCSLDYDDPDWNPKPKTASTKTNEKKSFQKTIFETAVKPKPKPREICSSPISAAENSLKRDSNQRSETGFPKMVKNLVSKPPSASQACQRQGISKLNLKHFITDLQKSTKQAGNKETGV